MQSPLAAFIQEIPDVIVMIVFIAPMLGPCPAASLHLLFLIQSATLSEGRFIAGSVLFLLFVLMVLIFYRFFAIFFHQAFSILS
jgi:hypothetical protein